MNPAQIFESVITLVKADTAKALLPALATFFNSVSANPSGLNFIVASARLQVDLIAAIPTIEADVLKSIAASLNAAVAATLAPQA